MQRTIVASADLTGDALADLKSWLGIARPDEDSLLVELLHASVALCEAFTGQAPLVQTVEERLATVQGRRPLRSRPIQEFVTLELIAQDGTRSPVPASGFSFVLDDSQGAWLELNRTLEGQAVVVRIAAGIAADWASLPDALKQGVIRMAAYHHRDRDRDSAATRGAPPPASVAALWRPWRIMRLA